MPVIAKRLKAIRELVPTGKLFALTQALETLKTVPGAKFRESIDVSINLGVDPRKSDQTVRGAVVLPNGTGKKIRVAVFTTASHAEAARQAGADLVGLDDLAESVKAGEMNFDIVVATPDAMRVVGQLGQLLGPRGLMPNPKEGTVTMDVATAVKNAKSGQVRFRTDKGGVVHCTVGKIDFANADLMQNIAAVMSALVKAKPITAKGVYIKKVTVSSTMGPGLAVDLSTIAF